MAAQLVLWVSLAALVYAYAGYGVLLKGLAQARRARDPAPTPSAMWPSICVVIAAYNEERVLRRRLDDLLANGYPADRLRILVASDGSSDGTVAIAQQYRGHAVEVLDCRPRRGKALTHNLAVHGVAEDVVVFTDADTTFAPGCLRTLVTPLADPAVGCVVGNLVYRPAANAIADSTQLYWRRETEIRLLESRLGILCTATGACMAVRRSLWQDLGATDDSDFATPLDVIRQGFRVVFQPDAVAFDEPAANARAEFRSRVRMTSKNFAGTARRWGPTAWIRHPLVTWALVSHKFLRWVGPFFAVAAIIATVALSSRGAFYRVLLGAEGGVGTLVGLGWLADRAGRRLPVASAAWSFVVANAGMGLGVVRGGAGFAPAKFRQE